MSYAGIAFAAIALLVNLSLLASYGMVSHHSTNNIIQWSLFFVQLSPINSNKRIQYQSDCVRQINTLEIGHQIEWDIMG